ncbi:MAG: T9SS type A sorting domain-containing protein, partial [Saprospiraceae bacterium]|nr:T9SS type A sorting domain-containing protein [Saprospiraceae bacterium]
HRLQDYFKLIPKDNTAFINYALSVYPDLYSEGPTADPDYGVGWHYLKSLSYDATEAQNRTNILQSIVDLYYPNGEPTTGDPDVCCKLDTIQIKLVDAEVNVIGGVKPYNISFDTTGNVVKVTVLDYDGCESKTQIILSSSSEQEQDGVKVYPNPASTEIYIDLNDRQNQIKTLRLISIHGQEILQSLKSDQINISKIKEGVYILQIELASGEQLNKRVLIMR